MYFVSIILQSQSVVKVTSFDNLKTERNGTAEVVKCGLLSYGNEGESGNFMDCQKTFVGIYTSTFFYFMTRE